MQISEIAHKTSVAAYPEIDHAWGEEALRRLAAYDAGRSKTYSMDEVLAPSFEAVLQSRLVAHRSGAVAGVPAQDVLGHL